MQARGPLMVEHRTIEEMIAVIAGELDDADAGRTNDPHFVDAVVDFFRVYADRTHHGKEEDLFFRGLEKKSLSVADRQLMAELVADHVLARQVTSALVDANARYRDGDKGAVTTIREKLRILADFYPVHIEKEDSVFFPASRSYMTEEEEQVMLSDFREFDRKMIHERYRAVIKELRR